MRPVDVGRLLVVLAEVPRRVEELLRDDRRAQLDVGQRVLTPGVVGAATFEVGPHVRDVEFDDRVVLDAAHAGVVERDQLHAALPFSLSWNVSKISPTPSMRLTSSSPAWRKRGGSRRAPTPDGVPVNRRSPGRSGVIAEMYAINSGTEKIISAVVSDCTDSPFRRHSSLTSVGPNSSVVTTQGPIGPNPGNDLPRLNCGAGPWRWTSRADRSWPTATPAMCDQASCSEMCAPPLPTTATSSTSQSTIGVGSATSARAPARQVGDLVKIRGVSGAGEPPPPPGPREVSATAETL